MANLQRRWPSVPLGMIPSGQDLAYIDQNTFLTWNGDGGGAYAPSAPVVFAGAAPLVAVGPWRLANSASVQVTEAAPVTFDERSNLDAFRFGAGHDGAVQVPLDQAVEAYAPVLTDALVDVSTFSIKASKRGARFLTPIRVHDGAQLDKVRFTFVVQAAHASVPEYLVRFRVIRVDADGNIEALRGPSVTTDSDGFQPFGPRPLTGAAWAAANAPQTFDYLCTQKNVVDIGAYTYWAEIVEEDGVGAWEAAGDGNRFVSTRCYHSGIQTLSQRH